MSKDNHGKDVLSKQIYVYNIYRSRKTFDHVDWKKLFNIIKAINIYTKDRKSILYLIEKRVIIKK